MVREGSPIKLLNSYRKKVNRSMWFLSLYFSLINWIVVFIISLLVKRGLISLGIWHGRNWRKEAGLKATLRIMLLTIISENKYRKLRKKLRKLFKNRHKTSRMRHSDTHFNPKSSQQQFKASNKKQNRYKWRIN